VLGHGIARAALTTIAVLTVALVTVPIAGAHAQLITSEPANDVVLDASPAAVTLRFSEPVETAFGAVRVYDARARRVDAGEVDRPSSRDVRTNLDRRLARGTYTVTWRVVSADAHPVSGAFVFHVQEPGANAAGVAAEVLADGTPTEVSVLFACARALAFALILLLAGGSFFLAYALADGSSRVRSPVARSLAVAAVALALVAASGIVLQGAAAGGFGLAEALQWDVVSAVAETRFGRVWLGQATLALLCAVVLIWASARGGRSAWLAVPPACLLVAAPSASGHASVSGGFALVSDLVHVGAAAAWVGGLATVVLALVWTGNERWELAARIVPRFSTAAVGAVAALVVAGVTNGYLQVRVFRGLWETTYGQLLMIKVLLVLPLLALGAYNNRYAVPRLRRGIASALERTRFVRTVSAELAIMAAIVATTAALVAEPPARAQVAPTGPHATTAMLGALELNLVVDPAAAGSNVIHLYLTDQRGRPTNVDEATVSATLASKRIGPLRLVAHRAGPGHFAVHGAQLALAGDWQLRVAARRGEFDAFEATVSVPIRKER
jgi:copper transport protein